MYILKTKASFDSAHFLSEYEGKCKNLHGHRWSVEVQVMTEELSEDKQHRGMYVDFGELKGDLKKMCDEMDHALIYETGTLKNATIAALKEEAFHMIEVPFRPTAENMAKFFYEKMQNCGYNMTAVTVYETPNNAATYMA